MNGAEEDGGQRGPIRPEEVSDMVIVPGRLFQRLGVWLDPT
jgi:hypothetical protein